MPVMTMFTQSMTMNKCMLPPADIPGNHGHSHAAITPLSDPALATKAGIFAVKVSLVALLITALFQLGVALRSGSVALLADTIHNFADALTAIPLWLAFSLSRRLRNTATPMAMAGRKIWPVRPL